MDPISLTASLIAIVQVGGIVLTTCRDYCKTTKNAAKELSLIAEEVEAINSIIQEIVKMTPSKDSPIWLLVKFLSEPSGAAKQCFDELRDSMEALKASKQTALSWAFKKSEIEDKLKTLSMIKATLQLGLAAESHLRSTEVQTHTRSIPLIQQQLQTISNNIDNNKRDLDRREAVQWLSDLDPSSKQNDELIKAANGTGEWLLKHGTYLQWKDKPSLLWLRGNVGSGKTVLCARVIDDLKTRCDNDADIGLCYFYVDGSTNGSITYEIICRCLIAQLADQKHDILDNLPFRKDGPARFRGYVGNRGHGMMRNLWTETFEKATRKFRRVFVVIDALDECEKYKTLEDLFATIRKVNMTDGHRVQFFVSSRDTGNIRSKLQDMKSSIITVEGQSLDVDLKMTLQQELSCDKKFRNWPPELKQRIETSLLPKARGSFRWLECQLHDLRRCITPAEVYKLIDSLPPSLERHYMCIIENFQGTHRELAQNLLRWVAFALRPLSVQEVSSAISISVLQNPPVLDKGLTPLDLQAFLDRCSSLVSTYTSSDASHVFVRLAHYSVREFLLSNTIKHGSYIDFAMEKQLANLHLANSCISYFQEAVRDAPNELWTEFPLASYAGHFWAEHHKLSEKRTISTTMCTMVTAMFNESESYYQKWQEVASIDRPWTNEDFESQRSYTPLYCAAFFGFDEVVKSLVANGSDPNQASGIYGTALQAAAFNGHITTVRTLISADANLDAERGFFKSAITTAAANGHHAVIRVLLEAGASLKEPSWDDERSDPLFMAAYNGHSETCKLLLEKGAKETYRGKRRPNCPLEAAIMNENIDVVREFLRYEPFIDEGAWSKASSTHSIDFFRELVGCKTISGMGLKYAAIMGDKTFVLDMVDKAAETSTPSSEPSNYSIVNRAFSYACRGGDLSMMKELMARGANPLVTSTTFSPLEQAVYFGASLEAVQTLIASGVNPMDESHPWNLLEHAIERKHQGIAEVLVGHGVDTYKSLLKTCVRADATGFRMLLDLGADIHHAEADDETPIMLAAAQGGSTEIIEYLLKNEVGHGAQGSEYISGINTTPLVDAIRHKRWKAVRILIDAGADVIPPLVYAISNDDMELVEELLRLGVDLNQGGTTQRYGSPITPLGLAAKRNRTDIMNRLISAGARVDQQDENGFSALHIAATNDSPDSLKALIHTHQADITVKLRNGSQPVHSAASKGTAANLKILLDAGAKIDSTNDMNRTPLHWAAESGNWENVEVLLKRGADAKVKSMDARLNTALEMAYMAREMSNMQVEDPWDDTRIDQLLESLKVETGGAATFSGPN